MTIAPPGPPRAPALPRPIRAALGRVDRRLRAARTLRGLGTLLVSSAAIAAGAMAIDFARPLPTPARWACWVAWAGTSAVLLLAAVPRPMLGRHDREQLAAVAGRASGERGARLTAAVSLAEQGGRAHGSPALIAALVDRAAAEAGSIDLRRAVPLGRAWRRLGVGLAAAGLVGLVILAIPDPCGLLARRLLLPWHDPGSAGLLTIAVEPGDAVLGRGDPLTVSAAVRPRFGVKAPESARIEWTGPDGDPHALTMGPGPGPEGEGDDARRFAITLPSVDRPIAYRVAAGSAWSPSYRVLVVDPPRVVSDRWTVTPPPYTGREAEGLDSPDAAVVQQDSRVAIVATTDRPARRVTLSWPVEGAEGPATIDLGPSAGGTSWSVEVAATASGPFAIDSWNEHMLIGRPGRSGRLEVRPDAPPVVALGDHAGAVGPAGRLVLPVAARDDLAVASAELHLAIVRLDADADADAEPEVVARPIDLDGLGSPEARGVVELDLGPLGLGDGDAVTVRVRVVDNRPAPRGPNEAWSAPTPLLVVADARRHEADRLEALLRPAREELEALAAQAAENRRQAGPLRQAADAARRDDSRWSGPQAEALDELEEAARALVDRLRTLASALEADPTLGPLADPAREAAEAEAAAAVEALDAARDADSADDRLDSLRRAEGDLAAASGRLDDLRRQFDALAEVAAARPELADLAGREADLAERADALADAAEAPGDSETPIDPGALRDLRDAQRELTRALADLMRQAPELGDEAAAARSAAESARGELDRARDPSQAADSARSAAEAMRQAADRLRRASGPADPASRADQLARSLGDPGAMPSSSAPDGEPADGPPGPALAGASDPGADLDLRSERAWGSLPGHLRTEILQSSPDRYRPEYAPLIRLYFREIARAASGPGPGGAELPPPTPGSAIRSGPGGTRPMTTIDDNGR